MVEGKDRVNIYLRPDIKDRVKKEADKLGITMTGFINVCIMEYLNQRDSLDAISLAKKLSEIMEKTGVAPASDAGCGQG